MNSTYQPLLQQFGAFRIAKPETVEASASDLVLDELRTMREMVSRLYTRDRPRQIKLYNVDRDMLFQIGGKVGGLPLSGIPDEIYFRLLAAGLIEVQERSDDEPFAILTDKGKDYAPF